MINPISLAIGTAIKTATEVAKASSKSSSSSSSKSNSSSSSKSNSSSSSNIVIRGSSDDYNNTLADFKRKYRQQIEGISRYNNVDLSVATEMFMANLRNNDGTYKGGGVANNWEEMRQDYYNLKNVAIRTSQGKTTSNSRGQKIDANTGEVIGNGSWGAGTGVNSPIMESGVQPIYVGVGTGGNSEMMEQIVGLGVLFLFFNMFRK